MIPRVLILTLFIIQLGINHAPGQTRSAATEKGALILSGGFSFSNQGGDLYEDYNNESLSTLIIVPGLFYFVTPGVGLGFDVSYNRRSRGSSSYSTWGAGPKAGYFMDSGTNVIPFWGGGFNFLSSGSGDESQSGFRIKLGLGLLMRKDHMGVSLEAGYLLDKISLKGNTDSTTGTTFLISMGFSGLFY